MLSTGGGARAKARGAAVAAPRAGARGRHATAARRRAPPRAAAAAAGGGAAEGDEPAQAAPAGKSEGKGEGKSIGARVRDFFIGGEKLNKERLAKLGTSALLSYGAVSNLNAITLVIVAWCGFASNTGLSPLAPGQWKAFLAAYTALYAVVGNLGRPLRFTLSVAAAPFFDRIVKFFQGEAARAPTCTRHVSCAVLEQLASPHPSTLPTPIAGR